MGTLRTAIGVWFQFWGVIGMIAGVVLLVFGGSALSIPTFDLVAPAPFSLIINCDDPTNFEMCNTHEPFGDGTGCFQGFIINQNGLCQRIGSDFTEPSEITGSALSSILGFGGLIYLGFGIFNFLIGTVIRGK